MVTVCAGCGFTQDEIGRLALFLRTGCNALSCDEDLGLGVMGVDRFDEIARFGADDSGLAEFGASGTITTVGTSLFNGSAPAVDATITNPSQCRSMMWFASVGHFINWSTGSSGAGRLVFADLVFIDGAQQPSGANEHSLGTGLGSASLSLESNVGPFLLGAGLSVTVGVQNAYRTEGAVTGAQIINGSHGVKLMGFFV